MKSTWYERFGKRLTDLGMTLAALTLLWPVLLCLAMLVWLKLGRPVFFRQTRPGLHGRPFELIKFRSMRNIFDAQGNPLPDAERLTGFGRWLRSTSLDELPELWNVLKGDMSLVGPRPLLMQYLERYTSGQNRRHEVRPGITGWAQVNGRNCLAFSQRLVLDVWYVDHITFLLDLKILFMTLMKIVNREGVIVDQDVREIDDLGLYVNESVAEEKVKLEQRGLRDD